MKPLDEFYRRKSDGRPFSYCRPCKNAAQIEWDRRRRGLPLDAVLKPGTEHPVGSTYIHQGYVLEKVGTDRNAHPRANKHGWVFQHVLVMEDHLGHPIGREFTIHHRNADRSDNRIENLELRVGNHGKGGYLLETILRDPESRNLARKILEQYED